MRRAIFLLGLAGLMLPAAAGAVSVSAEASAQSGGRYAESSQAVSTGDAGASVSVSTSINSNSGGTSTIDVTTEDNGAVYTEHTVKIIPPGSSVTIEVSTSTQSHADGEPMPPRSNYHAAGAPSSAASVPATSSASVEISSHQSQSGGFFSHIAQILRHLFFWW